MDERPEWGRWPGLLMWVSPCLAAGVTFGIAYADLHFLPQVNAWRQWGAEVVILFNGALAGIGTAAGAMSLPGSTWRRVGRGIGFGLLGAASYLAILIVLRAWLPKV